MGEHHYHDEMTERHTPKRAYELAANDIVETQSQLGPQDSNHQLESPHPRRASVSHVGEWFAKMDDISYDAVPPATD